MAKPTLYTPEVAKTILERIANGEPQVTGNRIMRVVIEPPGRLAVLGQVLLVAWAHATGSRPVGAT